MSLGYKHYRKLLDTFLVFLRQKLGDSLISVVLYGSVARGEARLRSDIDLLIIVKDASNEYFLRLEPILKTEKLLKRTEAYNRLCSKDGVRPYVSYLVLSLEEAQENRYIYLDMIEDSIIIFDRNNFFEKK